MKVLRRTKGGDGRHWRMFVRTDGCHPNRADNSLIADALARTISE